MSRTLKAYVHVVGEDNQPVVLKPGDEVPKWAEKQVTNPKVFAGDDDADGAEETAAPVKRAPRKAAAKRPARGKAATRPDPVADPAQGDDPAGDGGSSDGAGESGDGGASGSN